MWLLRCLHRNERKEPLDPFLPQRRQALFALYSVAAAVYRWMVVFGILGYLFKKLQYPLAPLVLAIVLGDNAESAFRQAMLMSQGQVGILFANWLVGSMTTLALVLLLWPLLSWLMARLRGGSR